MNNSSYKVNEIKSLAHLVDGVVLALDKPEGWTSFDLVNRLKWLVKNRFPQVPFSGPGKLKIGHAGTLDPLATGLVVICTGRYTKLIESLQAGTKVYTGTVVLGQTTPSYDLETEPQGSYPTEHITLEMLETTALQFEGSQMQVPPIYSAKQVAGRRAYHAARNGEALVLRPAQVHVHEFRITRFEMPEVDFQIHCSKGTYIRSLAHELGQNLGSGSYLKSLRRIQSEPFNIDTALNVNQLEKIIARLTPQPVTDQ